MLLQILIKSLQNTELIIAAYLSILNDADCITCMIVWLKVSALLLMGCAWGLGLGEQHVQDKSSLKWCYIQSSGIARILVLGALNLILFKKNFE